MPDYNAAAITIRETIQKVRKLAPFSATKVTDFQLEVSQLANWQKDPPEEMSLRTIIEKMYSVRSDEYQTGDLQGLYLDSILVLMNLQKEYEDLAKGQQNVTE